MKTPHEGFEIVALERQREFRKTLKQKVPFRNFQPLSIPGLPTVGKHPNEPFGRGYFENTPGNVHNFLGVLDLASKSRPQILQIIEDADSAQERIAALIEASVLKGMKTLDLGSGDGPSRISKALEALGAESWSADFFGASESRHIGGLDFNAPQDHVKLKDETGGNFDFVVEGIVAPKPFDAGFISHVDLETIGTIAHEILKPESYLMSLEFYRSFTPTNVNNVLRKTDK